MDPHRMTGTALPTGVVGPLSNRRFHLTSTAHHIAHYLRVYVTNATNNSASANIIWITTAALTALAIAWAATITSYGSAVVTGNVATRMRSAVGSTHTRSITCRHSGSAMLLMLLTTAPLASAAPVGTTSESGACSTPLVETLLTLISTYGLAAVASALRAIVNGRSARPSSPRFDSADPADRSNALRSQSSSPLATEGVTGLDGQVVSPAATTSFITLQPGISPSIALHVAESASTSTSPARALSPSLSHFRRWHTVACSNAVASDRFTDAFCIMTRRVMSHYLAWWYRRATGDPDYISVIEAKVTDDGIEAGERSAALMDTIRVPLDLSLPAPRLRDQEGESILQSLPNANRLVAPELSDTHGSSDTAPALTTSVSPPSYPPGLGYVFSTPTSPPTGLGYVFSTPTLPPTVSPQCVETPATVELRSPLRTAIETVLSIQRSSPELTSRQTRRSALFAAQRQVWRAMFSSTAVETYAAAAIAWSFYFKLRSRAESSPTAIARRLAAARRTEIAEIISKAPRPMIGYTTAENGLHGQHPQIEPNSTSRRRV